jgi:hypothetical protein
MYRRPADDAADLVQQVLMILLSSKSDYASLITAAVDAFFLHHAVCTSDGLREARELVAQLDWELIKSLHPNGLTVEREHVTVDSFMIPDVNIYNSITHITVNDRDVLDTPDALGVSNVKIQHSEFSRFLYCTALKWLKVEPAYDAWTEELRKSGLKKFGRGC